MSERILLTMTMPGFLNNVKKIIFGILFAPICANCEKIIPNAESFLCNECFSSIRTNKTLFCPVCRARVPELRKICHFDSYYLLAAAAEYGDPAMKNAIHFFKYNQIKGLGEEISEIMLKYIGELNLSLNGFSISPIPLHRKKEFTRGFNQSQVIAELISKKLNLPFENFLKRIKNNKQQAGLKEPEERKENMRGCFAVENPKNVSGKNIILVDDVFTSGATMNEAVKVLKSHGAKKIIALVAAKA